MNPSFKVQEPIDLNKLQKNEYDANAKAELVRNSPWFDEQWYRQEYPEIEYHDDGNPDPAYHYANYGYKEGLLPSILFDARKYSKEQELKDINPLLHYIAKGCEGNYRVIARQSWLATKCSLLQPLTPSESIYAYELGYYTQMGIPLDLMKDVKTFAQKLFYVSSLPQNLEGLAADLYKTTTLAKTLQKRFGFSKEQAPDPVLICKNADELIEKIDSLPERFNFTFNGMPLYRIQVEDKHTLKQAQMTQNLKAIENNVLANLKSNNLSPTAAMDPCIVVENFDERKDFRRYEFLCFNGEVKYVLAHKADSNITLLDKDFNPQPCQVALSSRGYTPTESDLVKPSCFDQLVEKAQVIAKEFKFVAVLFSVSENDFICERVRTSINNGIVLFSNDYETKLGDLINL